MGDVNGDGFSDLFIYSSGYQIRRENGTYVRYPANLRLYYGSTEGLPTSPSWNTTIEGSGQHIWNATYNVHSADVNADGFDDMISSYGTLVQVHYGSVSGIKVEPDQVLTHGDPNRYIRIFRVHAPLDLNGDEYEDMAVEAAGITWYSGGGTPHKDWDTRYVSLYVGSANGFVKSPVEDLRLPVWPYREQAAKSNMEFTDVNGDGLDDIVLSYFTGNRGLEPPGHLYAYWCINPSVRIHLNDNGTFASAPDVVQRLGWFKGSWISGSATGDFDGDGFGDLAIGIHGDEWGDEYNVPGRLIILFGAGLMLPTTPALTLNETTLYSGYEPYRFKINANPTGLLANISNVSLTFDTTGLDISMDWQRTRYENPFIELFDPWDYIQLLSDGNDISESPGRRSLQLDFWVVPDWNWPDEEFCDVVITVETSSGVTGIFRYDDAFRVENDLQLLPGLSVSSEWQGDLSQGYWVRVKEKITFSDLGVTYEGTSDVYPPDGICNVSVTNQRGTTASSPISRGNTISIAIDAVTYTQLDEVYVVSLTALPGKSEAVHRHTFKLNVDGSRPTFGEAVPNGTYWVRVKDVDISITIDDIGTSGIDTDTIEYQYSTDGFEYVAWTDDGIILVGTQDACEAQLTLTLAEGTENYVRWRAKDLVGNGYSISEPAQVLVDTEELKFADSFYNQTGQENPFLYSAGVNIADPRGSGVDVSSVQYRISTTNISGYGGWMDWSNGTQKTDGTVKAAVTVELVETKYNFIQWRAKDVAGNGLTESPHYQMEVDLTTISFSKTNPFDGIYHNSTMVSFQVAVWDPPGGSGVNLSSIQIRFAFSEDPSTSGTQEWSIWSSVGLDGVDQEAFVPIEVQLVEGTRNMVQLRGWDMAGNGPAVSMGYKVMVDISPPELLSVDPGPLEKQIWENVVVTAAFHDDGAGLSDGALQYRFSTTGGSTMGEWIPMDAHRENDDHIGTAEITFERSDGNVVQFRAIDRVGNTLVTKPHVIWVNRAPIVSIESPANGTMITEGSSFRFDASGTVDPDGDDLIFLWFIGDSNHCIARGPESSVKLPPGEYVIVLRVSDLDGIASESAVTVTVVPGSTSWTESPLVSILLLVIILVFSFILAVVIIRHTRRP